MPTRDVFNERGSRPLCSPRCVFSLYIFVWPVTCRRRSIDGHKRPRLAQEFRDERRKGEAEKKKRKKIISFFVSLRPGGGNHHSHPILIGGLIAVFRARAKCPPYTTARLAPTHSGVHNRYSNALSDLPPSNTEISVVCSLRSVAILMNGPAFLSLTTMNSHIYERPAFPRPSAWRPGQYKKKPTPSAVEWKHQVGNKIQDKWRWCWGRRWFFCKKGKKSHFGAAAGRYSWAPKSTSSKRQRRNELFEKSVVLEGGRDGGKTKIENRDHPISGGIFPFLYLSLSNFSFACRKFLPYTYQCVQVSASFYRIRNRMKRNGRSRSYVEEKVRARRKRDTVCVRGERRLFKNTKIPE